MLTIEEERQVVLDTNDSCLRLYKLYIDKKNWKHFNPTDYFRIGSILGWTAAKTEKCKTMLIAAGYLLIKKDTLDDSTRIYRILLGKDIVSAYKLTNRFPDEVLKVDKNFIEED